jgi:cytochrome c biogenesis protein ResB
MRHHSMVFAGAYRGAWWRGPREPRDFSHHALMRGAHPSLFDSLCRDLSMRLYEGRAEKHGSTRSASLRQGPAPRLGTFLFGLGGAGLIGCLLVGSGLGHDFRQRTGDGGVAHVAVPTSTSVRSDTTTSMAWPACLGLLGAGAWLASLRRRHFWIVAHPASDGRSDVWLAGTSWQREAEFESEFEQLLERARQKQHELA